MPVFPLAVTTQSETETPRMRAVLDPSRAIPLMLFPVEVEPVIWASLEL